MARLCTFLFHEVTDDPKSTGYQRETAFEYKNTIDEFRSYLKEIKKSGYPVRSVEDPGASDQDSILLTFDDGGKSAVEASKILDEYGWKGHFFVTTSKIDDPCFVSKEDILDLRQRGHIVGSHSHSHPNIFYNQSKEEMLHEWQTSCKILQDILQEDIKTASVPGGDMDDKTIETANTAGIEFLFTSEPKVKPWSKSGTQCFGRLSVRRGMPESTIGNWARFKGILQQQLLRTAKNTVKLIIFPIYNRRVKSLPDS